MNPQEQTITVALAGNPNSGKTSIFNMLTGAHYQTGNFSGNTVSGIERKVQHRGYTIRIIDLPGTYSLSSRNQNELVCREYIVDTRPDMVINVIDSGALERNLFLTTQLIEMGVPRVHALNMSDEAAGKGIKVNTQAFSSLLGGAVVQTVGHTGKGVKALLDAVVDTYEKKIEHPPISIPYDEHLETAIQRIDEIYTRLHPDTPAETRRWVAIKLLEGDERILEQEGEHKALLATVAEEARTFAKQHGDEVPILLANGRYGFIHGVTQEILELSGLEAGQRRGDLTEHIDGLLLHRFLGLPMFFFILWLMFQSTFTLGAYPADWIDAGVVWLGEAVAAALPEGLTRDMIVDGIIAGVGGVVVFLPNIVILFFFIAIFETSGYMARAAFLMDRLMHRMGLHGKAFIPMLVGFGCNVPAIMATRSIENRRDRIITILVNPFMSCSARLPVYVLLAGVFFAESAGTVVFLVHLIGILVALTAALALRNTLFRGHADPFVMELPPYRRPTARAIVIHMWEKAVEFLKKIGGVVLVGSIIIWFLQTFPQEVSLSTDYDAQIVAIMEAQPEGDERDQAVQEVENARTAEYQQKRYLGRIGTAVAPVFEPLGFDWKASIALLTGIVAKEIVVSTFGVLYRVGGEVDEESAGLREALAGTMQPLVAFGFMMFVLLYIPCLATFAAIRREAGSWGWAFFSIGFSMTLAWSMVFLFVQVGSLVLTL